MRAVVVEVLEEIRSQYVRAKVEPEAAAPESGRGSASGESIFFSKFKPWPWARFQSHPKSL